MKTPGKKSVAASPLEAHLGYWLRFVSNHVSHGFRRKLEGREVTVAEWVLLRELFDHEQAIPSELAERIGMSRGTISKLIDRVVAKGLVTRGVHDDDGRYQRVQLTAAGRALVPTLAALADENDESFFGHLTHAERARLERALKALVRHHELRALPID
jgi:DNA-binding MarR family transcriptional regulator